MSRVGSWLSSSADVLAFVAGFIIVGFGIALIYVPAAFIYAGLVLCVLAVGGMRAKGGDDS